MDKILETKTEKLSIILLIILVAILFVAGYIQTQSNATPFEIFLPNFNYSFVNLEVFLK